MATCPSCSSENPDSQRFCGLCGARLSTDTSTRTWPRTAPDSYTPAHLAQKILTSRSALEGERKLVTVMFCDIANSTPIAASVGAEAMHALLNRFFALALAEVHLYEGTVNQFLGDGFMALFGAPLAHEDHARRALLAALGIQQKLRVAHHGLTGMHEVRVRMGVNTGVVVVGKIGDNLRMDYTAVGDTTNLAARLQQHAEPGAIFASEATHRAAQPYFEFKPLGKHALKGIAQPMDVYDLLKVRSAGDRRLHIEPAGVGSVLVGRDRELSILSASLNGLREGSGGVVVVQGEPGSGKSRLVAEARRRAGPGRERLLEGRALSFGRKLSYWPFIEILKACFGIDDDDGETQTWRKIEQVVGELFGARAEEIVPYIATVLSLPMAEEYEQRVKFLDGQALGRQVFLSMREFFERLAKRQPVMLVMEDWHWVDQSSVSLCEHLLPLARSSGLAFWFVTRTEPDESAARIKAAVTAESGVRLQEIVLTPLPEDQSSTLIDNLVGASDLPQAVRGEILRKTEGNPFFIEEIIRALIADGTLVEGSRPGHWRLARPVDALTLPDTVQGVIVARIDRLEDDVKSVLKLASVIGRSFFLRILQAINEAGDPVDGDLVQLERAELIRMRRQSPELEYIFKHALVQEAAYGSILVERRHTIHRSVAHAIERLFADRLDEFTGLLAYHYALAEDWDKAQAYLFKAGDQSGRMAADAEALELYRQAETAYLKAAGGELAPLRRAMLDRKLGQALYGVGRHDQAVEHFLRALAHLGIHYPTTRAGVRLSSMKFLAAHFLRRLGSRGRQADRPSMDLEFGQEISATCQSLAWLDYFVDEERFGLDSLIELYAAERSGDMLGRVRGLATLGVGLMMFRAFPLARRRIAESVAIAQHSGQAAAIGIALLAQGWLKWVTGSVDESVQSFEQSAAAYKSIGDIHRWGGPTGYLSWVARQRAQFTSAMTFATDMVRLGRDSGDTHVVSWGLNCQGTVGVAVGPLDEVAARALDVRETSIRISSFRTQAFACGLLGKCRIRQGRLSDAGVFLREAISLIESRNLSGVWSADTLNAWAELCLINAARWSGAPRRAAIRDAGRACAQALRCTRDAVTWLPETWRLYGTLAWLVGDTESMHDQWKKSLSTAHELKLPVERARTLLEMGVRLGELSPVDEATLVFMQTGAKVDLAFSLHAQARMATHSDADVRADLERYDRVIVALNEVKAEYQLGVAYSERAQLHKQAERPELASADLGNARSCFAAVGAAFEQANAELEATKLV